MDFKWHKNDVSCLCSWENIHSLGGWCKLCSDVHTHWHRGKQTSVMCFTAWETAVRFCACLHKLHSDESDCLHCPTVLREKDNDHYPRYSVSCNYFVVINNLSINYFYQSKNVVLFKWPSVKGLFVMKTKWMQEYHYIIKIAALNHWDVC